MKVIGVIADTHGFLDPRVIPALANVDRILHAGDIGSAAVLEELAQIAPVTAVTGNNDRHLAELGLPEATDIDVDGMAIHLVHRLVDARPTAATQIVVFGHSHRVLREDRDGVLYLNPGAAGRVGFHREISVALLRIEGGVCEAEIIALGVRAAGARSAAARRKREV